MGRARRKGDDEPDDDGKVRTRSTVDAVVYASAGPAQAPHALLPALPRPEGSLRAVGHATVADPAARRELGEVLIAMDSPLEHVVSGNAAGLPGRGRRMTYTAVEPIMLVEVDADVSMENGTRRGSVRRSPSAAAAAQHRTSTKNGG